MASCSLLTWVHFASVVLVWMMAFASVSRTTPSVISFWMCPHTFLEVVSAYNACGCCLIPVSPIHELRWLGGGAGLPSVMR